MKITIKSFIAISVLSFASGLDASALVANRNVNRNVVIETGKSLNVVQTGDCLTTSQTNLATPDFFANESLSEVFDFQKEARLIAQQIADREEVRTIQEIMSRRFSASKEGNDSFEFIGEPTDFRAEAQILIKILADKAESKTISKLISEGKLFIIR